MTQYVYRFGGKEADGSGDQKSLLGGKGAGLAEMTGLEIPVPPGFTITTEVCNYFSNKDGQYPDTLNDEVVGALDYIGVLAESSFGDSERPMLVSVRSGAPVSMPGMMDTILNLGLNDTTVAGLAKQSGSERFAFDCYRRFVAMFGEIVLGVRAPSEEEASPFARLLEAKKKKAQVDEESKLSADHLKDLVTEYKAEIKRVAGKELPDDPYEQLWQAISAVFQSWKNPRAEVYRLMHNIPSRLGTAVNIQAMVFGNLGDDCGTGVAFTRNPSTGEKKIFGEFLINAQGEDVVAGLRTPEPAEQLESLLPAAHKELVDVCDRLETHFRDMQDLEFTIQHGQLWLLQTRTGKRSGRAMVAIAVDFVHEGLIDRKEAVRRIEPKKLDELMHPSIDPKSRKEAIARGLPASPGATIGQVVFTASEAEQWEEQGKNTILVRIETSPEDIHGMKAAVGILTARGGMTSHAAVVARGMGKCCVAGCSALKIDMEHQIVRVNGAIVRRGDVLTLDGSTGEVFLGAAELVPSEFTNDFQEIMGWVDAYRRLRVRTNADTPEDARTAREFGAEGIGLCRTEHMFFAPERILAMRRMILSKDQKGRRAALDTILPMQRKDFVEIFRAMHGYPVTIRLLDPPLHEFLPHTPAEIAVVAHELGQTMESLKAVVQELREVNPMLGHRGCRLAISYPEIYQTQAQAIAEAAVSARSQGIRVLPEIMIPFVSIAEELAMLRELVCEVMDAVFQEAGLKIPYLVGTMIELPRACLTADEIAKHADFFSFGTNDLTQTTFGFSRDDAGRYLPNYVEKELLPRNPFVAIDQEGVGLLMRLGIEKGRSAKEKLKIGICGEHGGEPSSVIFCHRENFDYVSCSPYRVPIARASAAIASLEDQE
jgi:pyruvate, orthophosphate dikinase